MAKTKRKKRVVKKSQIKSKPKGSSKSSSSSKKYETTDGKKFSDKADARAHQKKLNASGKGAGTKYDKTTGRGASTYSREEEIKKEKEEREENREEKSNNVYEKADDTELRNTAEFKALGKEDQEAVLAVFNAIANNDAAQANRLADAFRAATKLNDPIFNEQLKSAIDAIERGYVEIDKEAEFKEQQLKTRLEDVKKDYLSRREFLNMEQSSQLRAIERQYEVDLEETRQDLAARGFTHSTQRIKKEKFVEDSYGDMRESTNRKFSYDIRNEEDNVVRTERDTQEEIKRLSEITKAGKLDFLRRAEAQVGSKNLPTLDSNYQSLGMYGEIERNKIEDTLSAATSFVF